jgi:hypothetical protein
MGAILYHIPMISSRAKSGVTISMLYIVPRRNIHTTSNLFPARLESIMLVIVIPAMTIEISMIVLVSKLMSNTAHHLHAINANIPSIVIRPIMRKVIAWIGFLAFIIGRKCKEILYIYKTLPSFYNR